MEPVLIGIALFLAFGNDANENFKGFATVWGSAVRSYRRMAGRDLFRNS